MNPDPTHDSAMPRRKFLKLSATTVGAVGGLSALPTAEPATAAGSRTLRSCAVPPGHVRGPAAGRVGRKNLETGHRVQPGQALLAVVQPEVWVTANFKETQLARMKPGQPARVRVGRS